MVIVTAKRVIKTGTINFWRNRWLSLASIFMMSITLLTISLFVILSLVIHTTTVAVKDKMDMKVSFKEEVLDGSILSLKTELANLDEVKNVEYISKEEAIARWQQLNIKDSVKKLVNLENNPLPRSLEIKVKNPEDLESVEQFLTKPAYAVLIESTSYQKNRDFIKYLLSITDAVKKIGWGLSIIFFVISIVVILNTVRMAIYARQQEIEIMKLVGATDVYVNIPFVIEGILYGVFGSIIAILLMTFGAYYVSDLLDKSLNLSLNVADYYFSHLATIIFGQLLLAIVIGAICSTIGVRKYLRL